MGWILFNAAIDNYSEIVWPRYPLIRAKYLQFCLVRLFVTRLRGYLNLMNVDYFIDCCVETVLLENNKANIWEYFVLPKGGSGLFLDVNLIPGVYRREIWKLNIKWYWSKKFQYCIICIFIKYTTIIIQFTKQSLWCMCEI